MIMIMIIKSFILVTMRVEPAPWSLSPGCLGRGTAADRHTFMLIMLMLIMVMMMVMLIRVMKMIGIQKIKQIVLPVQFSSGSATARSAAA